MLLQALLDLSLEFLFSNPKHLQFKLRKFLADRNQGSFLEKKLDQTTKANNIFYMLAHATKYLTSPPPKSLRLGISSHEIVAAVCCQIRVAVYSVVALCPRCGSQLFDRYGDHSITCSRSGDSIL